MVFESNTLDFLWVQDGNQGSVSGEGLYTWVKYSHNADGSNLSDDSTGMEYIGFAYNKTERIESENPSDYEWCKIKGDDGEPGIDGYTIILDNENISFTTSSLKIPLNDQTAVCKVIVYQGTEQRTNFLIGEITAPIGITIKVENKIIYLSASTSTAIGSLSGSIDIPIQIDGIDFHKKISYSLALKGEDGDSPVSVYLSNENHTFSATSNGKAITSRIQTNVYAYYGSTPVAATVGNLTPPTGMKIDIVNNGQTNTFLNISVDSTLDKNGVLDIPVTVGENIYHCSFCYTLSPQGADGTPAKAIDITPSSQVFKSTDGGTTFSPDKITITPRIQGDIEYSKWQYSTDGGKTWIDITESTNGVSISSTILSIVKSSTLYTETITSIVFKCISNDPNYYDTCTISKLYDVIDIKSDIDSQFKETKETIAGIEQKVDKVNKSITDKVWQSDITTTLNNYDNTTVKDVRDRTTIVEKNLQGITSTVKDMQTTVEEKADGSTVTELTNRVSNVEQDVSGFKQTVESTYAKQDDLANVNKYAKSSFEQLSDKFSWIVESSSSQTSLTLTDSLISAVTKQFIIKDNNDSATIIEGGKIKANSITSKMLSSDALKSNNYQAGSYTNNAGYSKSGTFIDLSTGIIHTPTIYTDANGDSYINGHITAKSLTLGATMSLGTVSSGKNGFSLSKDGLLKASNAVVYGSIYASNGEFSGKITATSGTIGSFTLDSTYLQSSDKTVGLSAIASDWAFWAGGTNTNNAKFRVNHAGQLWATSATITGSVTATSGTIGGCSISNGTLIVPSANISGTLNASQIRVGDFTEYHDLTSETYSRYGFSIVADGNNNPWFVHTPQRDIQISPGQAYNSYKCNGGGTYHIEFEVSSTVQASETDSYGNNTYVNINIGLYGTNTSNSSCWYIPFGCRSNSSGSVQKVSTSVWLPSDVRSFSTFIQCAGFGTFSGTLKIRNISIRRMADTALIVDGSITADKIKANAITSDKISVSQLSAISANLGSITGGSINIGGKFIVDSNGNFIATNGSLTGTVNASSLTAKQYYKIYDSDGKNERTFVSWSGSMLSFGLVSQNGSNEAEIQILPGSRTVTFNGDIGATQGTIYANSINATAIYTNNKNTSMGVNLYTSGTLTVKSGTTLKSTLHVDGESGFYGKVTARSSFAFLDYNAEEDANANAVFRRPIASAGSNKSKVAFLQSQAGNKISIRAQYGSTSWGTATFTGSSSDIRLKRDIKDSSVNALSKIMQMQIREFNWKQTGVHQELGCVADELELIDPLLTTGGDYDDDGTMNIKSIDTLLLSEYAIKGIQELYRQNKQQQKRIEYLESQLKIKNK